MADNLDVTPGTGATIAADDIGANVLAQRVKPVWGPDGTGNDIDVATGKPLPVQMRSATGLIPIGEPTDAKSTATDTTSASLIAVNKQISASVQALATTLPAGTNVIGKIAGTDANDAVLTGNPVLVGGRASAAAPSAVSADADAVSAWYLRNGAQATALTAAGALIGGDAANGIDVDVTRLSALVAGEAHIGAVGGHTVFVDVALTLDTAIYASGDVLADSQVITNAMRVNDIGGILQSVTVIDQDDQKAAFFIYLLSANVSMGAENAAPSISDANALNILGPPIAIAVADYNDLGGVSVAGKDGLGKAVKPASGTRNLYVAVVNGTGTPTYTATGVTIRFAFLQD